MGKIYSETEVVNIWLGESDASTDSLVEIVQHSGVPVRPEPGMEEFEKANIIFAKRLETVATVINIVAMRPWWRRVWTVQECILSRNDPIFQCGFATFSWESFFSVIHALFIETRFEKTSISHEADPQLEQLKLLRDQVSSGAKLNEARQTLQAISALPGLRLWYQANQDVPLADCFSLGLGRQTSVAHDYIYGFLGLLPDHERERVSIDYRRSYWDTYSAFYDLLLEVSGWRGLQVLIMTSFHNTDGSRPSWMPDFSTQTDVHECTGFFLAAEQQFGTLDRMVARPKDSDILRLEGVFIDTVACLYPMPKGTASETAMERVMAWADEIGSDISSRSFMEYDVPYAVVEASKQAHTSRLFLGNVRIEDIFGIDEDHFTSY
ncbi:hypothetical protein BKA66DRAFT_565934 [Pyrenochaeta sp. MPI-SDFR-AT-0127]|nr:hypothetical protein BKA66DRAFT_565934 [Pyrenochaeta sp. MPI-SDFR-AT-0127]